MKSNWHNLYLGQAGQMYVMSEFLSRGWNVAVPEVNVGDDIFVVKDKEGTFRRAQVKTATGQSKKYGCSALFKLSIQQLQTTFTPDLHYIFTIRFNERWQSPLIFRRLILQELFETQDFGTIKNKYLLLNFRYHTQTNTVLCSKQNVSKHLNNWKDFPFIQH